MVQPIQNENGVVARLCNQAALHQWHLPVLPTTIKSVVQSGIAALAALLTILGIAFAVRTEVANRQLATAPMFASHATTITVTVGQGDSLWQLARRFGNPQTNIQERVDLLARANGLTCASSLVTGQRLLVRVENPVEMARLHSRVAMAK